MRFMLPSHNILKLIGLYLIVKDADFHIQLPYDTVSINQLNQKLNLMFEASKYVIYSNSFTHSLSLQKSLYLGSFSSLGTL